MDRFDKVYLASIATVSTASYSLFMMNDNLEESEDEANEFTTAYVTNRALLEVPSRMKGFVEVTVQSCSEGEFQEDFRMSKPQFNWLLQEVSPLLSSPRMTGRQTDNKMGILLAVLWLLANQESYRSVANRFDMSKSDLFDAFFRVINALNILAPKIITWPDEARRRCIEKGFSKASAISGVVGVIDGTYVPILSPRNDPQACVNRKCFYGITLQGICDHELLLTDCYTGYPSSVSEIRIFRNSDIYSEFIENHPSYFDEDQFIVGDKAYPVTQWCIPPYIAHRELTGRQTMFNTRHAKTRTAIERCWALLFGRFRRLQYVNMKRTELIPSTIIACCVLHNICQRDPDRFAVEYEADGHRHFACLDYVTQNLMHDDDIDDDDGRGNDDDVGFQVIHQRGIELRNNLADALDSDI